MATKSLVLSLVFCFVLVAEMSFSQEDQIGVYFGSADGESCTESTGLLRCYVVVKYFTDVAGIAGWQFELDVDEPGVLFGGAIAVGGINLYSFPRFLFGCSEAIPFNESMLLLDFSVYVTTPGYVYIRPLDDEQSVAYLRASDNTIQNFNFSRGSTQRSQSHS